MIKKVAVLALLVLIAGAGLVFYLKRDSRGPAGSIIVSGNIELTQVDIAFKTPGKLIERTVDEGDPVKKGQVVARLDENQLLAQRDRETAALNSALAQLAQAETALAWQKETLAADLAQRQADLSASQARLRELKTGSRPQEIQSAKAAVSAAEAEYERASRDWNRAQTLYQNDDISTAQYDQFRSRWEAAEAALKQAREHQALVLEGPRSEQIDAAAAQVEKARALVRMAESNKLEIKRREQEIAFRRSEIERAKANLAVIATQLDDTRATSPVDGIVLVKAADVGEVVAAGTPILTVGDIDHPWLRAYINETDLGRVKIGGRAKITTDSFPGKVYEGRISFISSEAEFTPKQIQTADERVKLVYRIKIDVENPNRELKSNMPADAEIPLE